MKSSSLNTSSYVALLRGINAGGHKIIKMESLRKEFEGMGFAPVATYVQSGNEAFRAPARAARDLPARIGEMLLRRFEMAAPVIVRTAEEIGEVARRNLFLKEAGIDVSTLQVCFLSEAPQKTAVKALDTIAAGDDRFNCCGREIFLHCPNGFAGPSFRSTRLKRFFRCVRRRAIGRRLISFGRCLEVSKTK